MRIYTKRTGFSFPEILVSCSIVIALSACALATADNLLRTGRYNAAKAETAAISVAVARYRYEMGSLPVNLEALTTRDDALGKGPWLDTASLWDPWHVNYNYYYPANQATYAIWSNGPDRNNDSGTPTTSFVGDDIGILAH